MYHLILSFWNFIFSPFFVDCTFTPKLNKNMSLWFIASKNNNGKYKIFHWNTECVNALELFQRCHVIWKRILRSLNRDKSGSLWSWSWMEIAWMLRMKYEKYAVYMLQYAVYMMEHMYSSVIHWTYSHFIHSNLFFLIDCSFIGSSKCKFHPMNAISANQLESF